jgi:RimJ/RimL family protein N-acetyltransferase
MKIQTRPGWTALDGSKISLLLTTYNHVPELYAQIAKSRKHLKNLAWSATITEQGVIDFVFAKAKTLDKLWTVMVDDNYAGLIDIRYKSLSQLELGYWIGIDYASKGYMKLALAAAVETLCLGDVLTATILEQNKRSTAVLKANYFQEISRESGWVTYQRKR